MKKYTVTESKFHGEETLYSGNSLNQAIKIARKHDCHECKCGGPQIINNETGEILYDWSAAKPFCQANVPFWA